MVEIKPRKRFSVFVSFLFPYHCKAILKMMCFQTASASGCVFFLFYVFFFFFFVKVFVFIRAFGHFTESDK